MLALIELVTLLFTDDPSSSHGQASHSSKVGEQPIACGEYITKCSKSGDNKYKFQVLGLPVSLLC